MYKEKYKQEPTPYWYLYNTTETGKNLPHLRLHKRSKETILFSTLACVARRFKQSERKCKKENKRTKRGEPPA